MGKIVMTQQIRGTRDLVLPPLVTACIITKCHNHDLPLRLYITLQSQIDQVITILYLIIRYLLLPNSLYLLTCCHLHNI